MFCPHSPAKVLPTYFTFTCREATAIDPINSCDPRAIPQEEKQSELFTSFPRPVSSAPLRQDAVTLSIHDTTVDKNAWNTINFVGNFSSLTRFFFSHTPKGLDFVSSPVDSRHKNTSTQARLFRLPLGLPWVFQFGLLVATKKKNYLFRGLPSVLL